MICEGHNDYKCQSCGKSFTTFHTHAKTVHNEVMIVIVASRVLKNHVKTLKKVHRHHLNIYDYLLNLINFKIKYIKYSPQLQMVGRMFIYLIRINIY